MHAHTDMLIKFILDLIKKYVIQVIFNIYSII
jgi:hypothetical protein